MALNSRAFCLSLLDARIFGVECLNFNIFFNFWFLFVREKESDRDQREREPHNIAQVGRELTNLQSFSQDLEFLVNTPYSALNCDVLKILFYREVKKVNWKVQLSLTLIGTEMKCKPENTEKPGLCFLSCQKEEDSVFITVCKTPVFIEGCVCCVLLAHHSVLLVTAYTVRDVPILPGGGGGQRSCILLKTWTQHGAQTQG